MSSGLTSFYARQGRPPAEVFATIDETAPRGASGAEEPDAQSERVGNNAERDGHERHQGRREQDDEDPWSRGDDPWTQGGSRPQDWSWGSNWWDGSYQWGSWQDWRRGPGRHAAAPWQRWTSQDDTWGSTSAHTGGSDERDERGGTAAADDEEHDYPKATGGASANRDSIDYTKASGGASAFREIEGYTKASGGDGAVMTREQGAHGDLRGHTREGDGVGHGRREGGGPSEKLTVPGFNGKPGDADGDDVGVSARSYLRQVAAWMRMTKISKDRQGLVLYQHLTGRAWVEAEGLDLDRLAAATGAEYFVDWVRERYLDVQVTQVGRSLSAFFRQLRKRPGQSIRDYVGEFDRAHARLIECGCSLPDLAAAWVFVDRMGLEEASELNLLASVGNQYNLRQLQKAAIVQDRALRKPWENGNKGGGNDRGRGEWWRQKKGLQSALMADDVFAQDQHDEDVEYQESETMPEEVAAEMYHTYMASAKEKYRDNAKQRGVEGEALKALSAEKLRTAKARSFCAGCRRRGHWHRDAECPLNQGKGDRPVGAKEGRNHDEAVKTTFQTQIVYVTWDLDAETGSKATLSGITDTACSRTVAGSGWLEMYMDQVGKIGQKPRILSNDEHFRFGASRIFHSNYAVVISFKLGNATVQVKVAIVNGELPLLLSRTVLGGLGMIMDIAKNRASFSAVGVTDLPLLITETGHPAVPLTPVSMPMSEQDMKVWSGKELLIHSKSAEYMVHMTQQLSSHTGGYGLEQEAAWDVSVAPTGSPTSPMPVLFYPKKIGAAARNMFLADTLNVDAFIAWWKATNITTDFWIEGETVLVRVHVVPRRTFFNPGGWATKNHEHKEALMQQLGSVRSTSGISCKTYRDLVPVHGLWQGHDDDGQYPVLWVGRSMFCRRKPQVRTPLPDPASLSHVVSEGASVERDEEGGPGERVSPVEHHGPTPVDSPGTAKHHPGGTESCPALADGAKGSELYVVGGAEVHGEHLQHPASGEAKSWTHHAADPRHDAGCGGQGDVLREVQGVCLSRCSIGISPVGTAGDGGQRQLLRGPEDVRQLGQSGGRERGQSHLRPGGPCGDSLQPERGELVDGPHGAGFFHDTPDDDHDDGGLANTADPDSRRRTASEGQLKGARPPPLEHNIGAGCGSPRLCPQGQSEDEDTIGCGKHFVDGPGGGPGDPRRDTVPGDQVGCPQGSSRLTPVAEVIEQESGRTGQGATARFDDMAVVRGDGDAHAEETCRDIVYYDCEEEADPPQHPNKTIDPAHEEEVVLVEDDENLPETLENTIADEIAGYHFDEEYKDVLMTKVNQGPSFQGRDERPLFMEIYAARVD